MKDRELKLESGFQGVRFSAALLPLGDNRFMAADDPLVGAVLKFVESAEERTIKLELVTGAMPLAVFNK